MVIRRVGPLSCAKIAGALYAVIGVFVGAIVSLAALAGAFANASADGVGLPFLFGTAAIVIFPIMYACFGFVGIFIVASVYNMLAGTIGGIELDVQ
jgi:hypothetical protein